MGSSHGSRLATAFGDVARFFDLPPIAPVADFLSGNVYRIFGPYPEADETLTHFEGERHTVSADIDDSSRIRRVLR